VILNFKKLGEVGPEIIILHGLFGMLDNWKTFGRKLSTDYQVYLVDQRDHGRSPHTEAFDYSILAADLNAFIETHHLEPELIIGHSMGGKTVMQFANDYPANANRIVVVDIGPKENEPGHETIFKALFSVKPEEIEKRQEAEVLLRKHIDDSGVAQFLMKNLSRNTSGGFKWKMNLNLLHENYSNILAEIKFDYPISVQTLFIKGEQSDYIDEANRIMIDDHFVNAEIIEIADAGHWVHADQGEKLLEHVKAFMLQ